MNEYLENGTYAAESYNHYYQLNLPESGSVFLNIAHGYGDSAVYDQELNLVSEIGQEPISLDAGSYIVHAHYSSPTYGELSLFSPQAAPSSDFFVLENGEQPHLSGPI